MRQWFNKCALDYFLHRGWGKPDVFVALPLGHKIQR